MWKLCNEFLGRSGIVCYTVTILELWSIPHWLLLPFFCGFFPVKNILVLSANNIDMLAPDTVDKSLIYIKKSNGPSIEPCETPQLIFSVLDLLQLYVTYCFLLDK